MHKKIVNSIFCLLFLFSPAGFYSALYANDSFRHEANAAYSFGKQSVYSVSNNIRIFSGGYTFYFQDVMYSNDPYDEAPFLNKSGLLNLSAAYNSQKIDIMGYSMEIDDLIFGGRVMYVFPVPAFIEAGYSREKFELKTTYQSESYSFNNFMAGLGYYITDTMAVKGMFERVDAVDDNDSYINIFSGGLKYIYRIDEQKALNFEGGFEYNDYEPDNDNNVKIFSIAGDYYYMPQFGIGCGVSINNSEAEDSGFNVYMVRMKLYVSMNVGIGFKYEHEDYENGDISGDYLGFSLTGRF